MKLLRWTFSSILRYLISRRKSDPGLRLRVSNLTRQTLLASRVEVADVGPKRRKGLLGRKQLAPGEGLWTRPCEAVHTFGMKFAIDLVYLDRENRIVKIRNNVPPWRLSACLSSHSVIELAAGSLRGMHSMPGDKLEFIPVSSSGTLLAYPQPRSSIQ